MILSWFHLPLLLLVSLLFLHVVVVVVVVVIIIIIIIIIYNEYRVFPGGKVRLGRAADHSPTSSVAVMEE